MYEIGVGMSVGRIAYWHDIRQGEIPNNVDPSRIIDNVTIIDNLQGRTIDQYTNETMQEVVDRYNEKQKKKSRRIEMPYVEWHRNNEQYNDKGTKKADEIKLAYECVLSYGNHENLGREYYSPETPAKRKAEIYNEAVHYFKKWTKDFEKMYPHLHILFSVIHADEPNGTIHCHICFQPRATDYKRGFDTQVSISRALEQDGIVAIKSAELAKEAGGFQLARLYKQFREHMKRDLTKIGYVMQLEEHGKKHIESNAYTELMTQATETLTQAQKEAEQILTSAQQKADSIEVLTSELEEIERIENQPKFNPNEVQRVQVKKSMFGPAVEEVHMTPDNYDSLRASADTKTLNRKTEEKIKAQQKAMEKCLQAAMTDREKELTDEVHTLESKVEDLEKAVEQQQIIIRQKERMIDKLTELLRELKEFIRERGLLHIFEQMQERWRSR